MPIFQPRGGLPYKPTIGQQLQQLGVPQQIQQIRENQFREAEQERAEEALELREQQVVNQSMQLLGEQLQNITDPEQRVALVGATARTLYQRGLVGERGVTQIINSAGYGERDEVAERLRKAALAQKEAEADIALAEAGRQGLKTDALHLQNQMIEKQMEFIDAKMKALESTTKAELAAAGYESRDQWRKDLSEARKILSDRANLIDKMFDKLGGMEAGGFAEQLLRSISKGGAFDFSPQELSPEAQQAVASLIRGELSQIAALDRNLLALGPAGQNAAQGLRGFLVQSSPEGDLIRIESTPSITGAADQITALAEDQVPILGKQPEPTDGGGGEGGEGGEGETQQTGRGEGTVTMGMADAQQAAPPGQVPPGTVISETRPLGDIGRQVQPQPQPQPQQRRQQPQPQQQAQPQPQAQAAPASPTQAAVDALGVNPVNMTVEELREQVTKSFGQQPIAGQAIKDPATGAVLYKEYPEIGQVRIGNSFYPIDPVTGRLQPPDIQ